MSINELVGTTPLSEKVLKEYNGCLKPNAFEQYRHRRLPKSYQILVPNSIARQVQQAINRRMIESR